MSADAARPVPGTLVLVIGASGAGKDSIIAGLAQSFPADGPVRIVTRAITRPASAGGEPHRPLGEAEFRHLAETGGFALHWRAHGLGYGLPVALEGWLAEGRVVVANASRGIVGDARAKYPGTRILHVAASPAVLAERLADRGREGADAIAARLARAEKEAPVGPDVYTLRNDGPLADAVAEARALLERLIP